MSLSRRKISMPRVVRLDNLAHWGEVGRRPGHRCDRQRSVRGDRHGAQQNPAMSILPVGFDQGQPFIGPPSPWRESPHRSREPDGTQRLRSVRAYRRSVTFRDWRACFRETPHTRLHCHDKSGDPTTAIFLAEVGPNRAGLPAQWHVYQVVALVLPRLRPPPRTPCFGSAPARAKWQ